MFFRRFSQVLPAPEELEEKRRRINARILRAKYEEEADRKPDLDKTVDRDEDEEVVQ